MSEGIYKVIESMEEGGSMGKQDFIEVAVHLGDTRMKAEGMANQKYFTETDGLMYLIAKIAEKL